MNEVVINSKKRVLYNWQKDGVFTMDITNVLNLVIFGMIVYIGLLVVPTMLENREA